MDGSDPKIESQTSPVESPPSTEAASPSPANAINTAEPIPSSPSNSRSGSISVCTFIQRSPLLREMVVLAVGFGLGQLADCSNYQRATDREAGQLKGQVEILTGERENLAEAKTKAEEQRDKALEAARALNRVEALFGKDWQLAARETLVLNGPPQRFGYGACRTGHCLALEFKLVMNGSGQATLLTVGSIDGSTPAQIPYANVEARVPAFLPPVPARIGCFYAYSTPHVKARILIEQATVGSILIGVAARQVPPPNDSGEADYAFVCPPEAGVAR